MKHLRDSPQQPDGEAARQALLLEAWGAEPPVSDFLAALGSAIVRVGTVRKTERTPCDPLRVQTADGRAFKLTRSAPGKPGRAAAALGGTGLDGFTPILAYGSTTMISPWIDGHEVSGPPAPRVAESAARIQAALHSVAVPNGAAPRRSIGEWWEWFCARTAALTAAGVLAEPEATRILDRVRSARPPARVCTWTHRDFCGENMVLDDQGRLHLIDNESMEIGFPDYDLARTWARWQMPATTWATYLSVYEFRRPAANVARSFEFWAPVALLGSIYWRSQRGHAIDELVARWNAFGQVRPPAGKLPGSDGVVVHSRSGLSVQVRCADPADRRWLGRFLDPWFRTGASADGHAAARIEMTRDQNRFLDLRSAVSVGNERVVRAMTLDSGFVCMPARGSVPGEDGLVAYDAKFDCVVVHRAGPEHVRSGPHTQIIAAPGNARARLTLMRVFREYLHQHLAQTDGIVMHAAALEHSGRAVLLAGPKRAGKTTALAWMLGSTEPESRAPAMIANDRVEIRRGVRGLEAVGIPTIVSVRPGTFELVPALARAFADGCDNVESAGNCSVPPEPLDRPLHMAPHELCRRLGRGVSTGAPLGAVLFVGRGDFDAGIQFTRLAPPEARPLLGACAFDLDRRDSTGGPKRTLFVPSKPVAVRGQAVDLDQLAAEVPAFSLQVGAEALGRTGGLDALDRALNSRPGQ